MFHYNHLYCLEAVMKTNTIIIIQFCLLKDMSLMRVFRFEVNKSDYPLDKLITCKF